MKNSDFLFLIDSAKKCMGHSRDPIHDVNHAERVVRFANRLSDDMQISASNRQAIVLASWWHDVARTVTKNPSLIWMPFVDDMLSAFMLLWHTLKTGTLSHTSMLAIRIIACKSAGTGTFLTKILLKKEDRVLVNIVKDADNLDVFDIERVMKLLELTEESALYHFGYKLVCRWFCLVRQLKMKTEAARRYILKLLRQFITWLKQPHIISWHIEHYGQVWMRRNLHRMERALHKLILQTAIM